MNPFRHVLVAVDFGPSSARALELAMKLVEGGDASLTLGHVVEIPSFAYVGMSFSAGDLVGPIEEAARAQLAALLASVRKRVASADAVLRRGYPSDELLELARESLADVIVIGTHGRLGVPHLFLGSVAEKVVRHSTVPVITVRSAEP